MQLQFFLSSRPTRKKTRVVMLYMRGLPKGSEKTFVRSTGVVVEEKAWNLSKQEIRMGFENATEGNTRLRSLKDQIAAYYQEAKQNGRGNDFEFMCDAIDRIVKGKTTEAFTLSFFDAYSEYLAIHKPKWTSNTYKKYGTLLTHLRGFSAKKRFTLSFEAIDKRFRDKFENYLLSDVGLVDSTVARTLRFLKTFMQWALESKYTTNTEFKSFKTKSIKTDILTLTWNELMTLFHADFSDTPSLERVRDVFCFQCFTGQRYSDIAKFQFADVHDEIWHVRTVKTKDVLRVPLSEFALAIIERYREQGKLPIISAQKFNQYLKTVCQKACLDTPVTTTQYRGGQRTDQTQPKYECITSHTARRTFITLSLERGMRPETVMKISGHTSLKMLQQYINVTEKITVHEVSRAWNPSGLSLLATK